MIKIERLYNGATATIVRNGVEMPVHLHMLMTPKEAATIKVSPGGKIMYTVDEQEIAYFEGTPIPVVEKVVNTAKKIVMPDSVKKLKANG
jgi:hypothetical protein